MTLARLSWTILTAAVAVLAFSTRPVVAETSCKSYLFGLCTSRYTPAEQAKIDQLPIVPNPSGFIEASALAPFIRSMGMAGKPASYKLIGVYYQPDALAEILSAGRTITAAFCKANVEKEFESVESADDYLKRLIKNAKKESEKQFDRNDPAVDRISKHYEAAANNLRDDVTIAVNGMTVLGTLAETDSFYAASSISAYTVSDRQRNAIASLASAVVWMRIGKRVIKLSASYPFLGKASVLAANDTLLNWLKSVEASN